MKRIFSITAGVLATSVLLSSCATIINGSRDRVRITSTPSNANIVIKNIDGETVYTGTTPKTLKLKTGSGYFETQEYTIAFNIEGYNEQIIKLKPSFSGWYVGNILVGGILGFLVIDPLTGAMWTFKENVVNADMIQSVADGNQVNIIDISQVPEEYRSSLVKVE